MKSLFTRCLTIFTLFGFLAVAIPGCYGRFTLTKKLYNWNGTLGSKIAKSAVMWILFIIPVYEIAGFIDFVILNVLEFWTGSNPMAMQEGETETRVVEKGGKTYTITASKNRFDIVEKQSGTKVSLVFDSDSKDVLVITKDGQHKVGHVDMSNLEDLILFQPDGQPVSVKLGAAPFSD